MIVLIKRRADSIRDCNFWGNSAAIPSGIRAVAKSVPLPYMPEEGSVASQAALVSLLFEQPHKRKTLNKSAEVKISCLLSMFIMSSKRIFLRLIFLLTPSDALRDTPSIRGQISSFFPVLWGRQTPSRRTSHAEGTPPPIPALTFHRMAQRSLSSLHSP